MGCRLQARYTPTCATLNQCGSITLTADEGERLQQIFVRCHHNADAANFRRDSLAPNTLAGSISAFRSIPDSHLSSSNTRLTH